MDELTRSEVPIAGRHRCARPGLALAFALTASLALANAAQAGFTFPFAAPGSCRDPGEPVSAMSDPNTAFISAPPKSCLLQCRHTVANCKQFVNAAAACQNTLQNDYLFYAKRFCIDSFTGTQRKDCLGSFAALVASQKTVIKLSRDADRSACETWGSTCETSCTP
jgi:hypothetical protein